MPYTVKKSGSGYKVYKKGTKKAFSKKPHKTKKEAREQQKALYASETNESLLAENKQDLLIYKTLFKVPKLNEFHVHYGLESGKNVIFNLIYNDGETMEDVDYVETQVTDGDIPSIEFFDDPQSEEAKAILGRYGLTGDDIENVGQEGYEKIARHYPEEDVKESLEFEKIYSLIMGSEEEKNS